MNYFKRFMKDRYGGNQLSLVLFILSITLQLIGQISKIKIFYIFSYVPLGIGIYRILSKNVQKRRMENYKFSIFLSPVYKKYNSLKNRIKTSKEYKYFRCPNCKQLLRIPRGKGKVKINCSKCNHTFEKRS